MEEKNTNKGGLTTAGLVLGIIAIVISFIPYINVFSFLLGILAFIFGIISLAQKKDKGTSIAAIVLGIVSIVVMYVVNYSTSSLINKGVQEINNSISSSEGTQNNSNNTKTEEKKYINIGETVTTKDWEISVESAEFSQRVDPPNKSGYYNYYQVDDSDDTYLYIVLNCKNISTLDIRADKVATVNVKYKNSYKYSSFSTIPSSTLGFTYTNITSIEPLTSDQIYYLAKMPKTVEDDTESPIEVEIKVNDTTYIYKYR